jgi:hypothetical protein
MHIQALGSRPRRQNFKEASTPVRFLTKFSLLAAALLAVALMSSSVRANDLPTGRFTLTQSAQWNNTLLPAGSYTIQMRRTLSTSTLLVVRGEKESIAMLVNSGTLCGGNCGEGSINMVSLGDLNVVTSINIAGLHGNFEIRKSARQREEEMAKNNHKPSSEQMAVHVDSNN